ncbi:MAG: hypothetical protein IPP04_21010 [Saprospiraceae bacterium]|nr:hypothetical protein [Saprospiraceae bacterium]
MNISLNWLKEFLTIHQSPAELAETLTNLGLAVDGYADYEYTRRLEGSSSR